MKLLSALASGLIFGAGLILSGMSDPAKVIGFLDLGGQWDPSLAFVMGGGVGVAALAFAWAKRRERTWLGLPMQVPTRRDIDRRLVVGSALFGIGWGLSGFCPGPGLVSLGAAYLPGCLFATTLALGVLAGEWFVAHRAGQPAAAKPH